MEHDPTPCPRCGEKEVQTQHTPHRRVRISTAQSRKMNLNERGDLRRDDCSFCEWWSEGRWDGHQWVWTQAKPMTKGQEKRLELRLKALQKKRTKKMWKGGRDD